MPDATNSHAAPESRSTTFSHGLLELHTRGPRGAALARSRTARQIDPSGRIAVFESLKKRRRGVYRAVPVPPELLDALDMVHGIREAQRAVSQFEI
jgi:hypothetical protein